MPWLDYAIIAVIGASALLSLFRGMVRETLSLLAWIVALWVALTFCDELARTYLGVVADPDNRGNRGNRVVLAFFGLFLVVLLVFGVVNFWLGKRVRRAQLSGVDRVIGCPFGALRGVLVVVVMVLAAGLTAFPAGGFWDGSGVLGRFQSVAVEIRDVLPAELAKRIKYP